MDCDCNNSILCTRHECTCDEDLCEFCENALHLRREHGDSPGRVSNASESSENVDQAQDVHDKLLNTPQLIAEGDVGLQEPMPGPIYETSFRQGITEGVCNTGNTGIVPTPQSGPIGPYSPRPYREHISQSSENEDHSDFCVISPDVPQHSGGGERDDVICQALCDTGLSDGRDSIDEVSGEGSAAGPSGIRRGNTGNLPNGEREDSGSDMDSECSDESDGEDSRGDRSRQVETQNALDHLDNREETSTYWGYFRVETFQPRFATTRKSNRIRLANSRGQCQNSSDFLLADHSRDDMPHYHILFKCCPRTSYGKVLKRIARYLGLTPGEQLHLENTLTPCDNVRRCILYMMKYGVELVWPAGRFFLKHYYNLVNSIPEETLGDCLNIIQARRARTKHEGNTMLDKKMEEHKSTMELIKSKISGPYSVDAFNAVSSDEEQLRLFSLYGNGYEIVLARLVDIMNKAHRFHQPRRIADRLALCHANASPTPAVRFDWLQKLFDSNNINKYEFWGKFQDVADKTHPKINAFCIRGPANCFKSQTLRLLLSPLHVHSMTRTGGNSPFWMQSMVNQEYILYEEPLLTQETVNDWKLLMEGEPVTAPVKNSRDTVIRRTPIFLSTNSVLADYCGTVDKLAIRSRIIEFTFTSTVVSINSPGNIEACAADQQITPADMYRFFAEYVSA